MLQGEPKELSLNIILEYHKKIKKTLYHKKPKENKRKGYEKLELLIYVPSLERLELSYVPNPTNFKEISLTEKKNNTQKKNLLA